MNSETEKIYNVAFDLIELRLNKKEQIFPFTVILEQYQTKPKIGMYKSVANNTSEQIDMIRNDLQEKVQKEKIVALCLCYDVQVTDPRTNRKTDAIQIELADKNGYTANIYIPYNFSDKEIIKKSFQITSDQKYY